MTLILAILELYSARGPPDAEHSEEDVTEYQYDQTVSW